jgi:hypothetical protein
MTPLCSRETFLFEKNNFQKKELLFKVKMDPSKKESLDEEKQQESEEEQSEEEEEDDVYGNGSLLANCPRCFDTVMRPTPHTKFICQNKKCKAYNKPFCVSSSTEFW